jgi:hypothetical protein
MGAAAVGLPVFGIVGIFHGIAGAYVDGADPVAGEIDVHELVHVAAHDHVGVEDDDALSQVGGEMGVRGGEEGTCLVFLEFEAPKLAPSLDKAGIVRVGSVSGRGGSEGTDCPGGDVSGSEYVVGDLRQVWDGHHDERILGADVAHGLLEHECALEIAHLGHQRRPYHALASALARPPCPSPPAPGERLVESIHRIYRLLTSE